MTQSPRCDPQEIAASLRCLVAPGALFEIRLLGCRRGEYGRPYPAAGYFDGVEPAVRAVIEADRHVRPDGVYVTLNPVDPRLLARSPNRITAYLDPQTGDHEIVRRTRILIDCDPVRPAGISAADGEVAKSLERAKEVREHLTAKDWEQPILACSGNGHHLVYQADLPNDERSGRLVEGLLKTLDRRFSDSRVKVDAAVFNASRITKLYGTVARKGASTPDRPHRLSRILEVPGTWRP